MSNKPLINGNLCNWFKFTKGLHLVRCLNNVWRGVNAWVNMTLSLNIWGCGLEWSLFVEHIWLYSEKSGMVLMQLSNQSIKSSACQMNGWIFQNCIWHKTTSRRLRSSSSIQINTDDRFSDPFWSDVDLLSLLNSYQEVLFGVLTL